LNIVHVPSKVHPKLSFLREPPISTTQERTAEKVIKLEPTAHRGLARAGDGDGAVAPPRPALTVALRQGRPASLTAETGTLRGRLLAAAVSLAAFYRVDCAWAFASYHPGTVAPRAAQRAAANGSAGMARSIIRS
jgi:hypothetical protein